MLASIRTVSRVKQKQKKVCDGAEIITREEVIIRLTSAEEEKTKGKKQKEVRKKKKDLS